MTLYGFLAMSVGGGLGMYFAVGFAFEWLYYRRRRADAASWKCQPRRFPTPALWRRDILLGSANLLIASLASGLVAHDIATANHSAVYLDFSQHGPVFSLATTLLYFLGTDAALYFAHRLYHRPALFRAIHLVHHRNTTPTAFTSAAVHPVEFFTYQGIMMAPIYILPIHVGASSSCWCSSTGSRCSITRGCAFGRCCRGSRRRSSTTTITVTFTSTTARTWASGIACSGPGGATTAAMARTSSAARVRPSVTRLARPR